MTKQKWLDRNKTYLPQRIREAGIPLKEPIVERLLGIVSRKIDGKTSPNPRNTLDMIERLLETMRRVGITDQSEIETRIATIEMGKDETLYHTIRTMTKTLET